MPSAPLQAGFRTVMCATDLSAEADEAVRQADAFARAHGAKLVVFHALPHAMPSSPLFPHSGEGFVALERQVLRILSERVAVLTNRVSAEVELKLGSGGSAHAAILKAAEEAKADLIVVGGEGPKGAVRALLGAVAERVVRYAHCAVWVARRGAGDGPMVVGTDFSPSAAPAIALAAGQRVVLVHALAIAGLEPFGVSPSETPAFPVWSGEDVAKAQSAAENRLEEQLRASGLEGVGEVSDLKPADALVSIAEREKARLIVVGTRGHTGFARVLLGSVAEEVVRKAKCPVLVAR